MINCKFTSIADDIPRLDLGNLPAYLPSECPVPVVTPQQVFTKLRKVKMGKSGGPDCLPPRVIKEFAYELCFPLANIFNCSLGEGIVPEIWKKAFVVPVPKTHPPSLDSLRPISLTCIFAKIFEDFVVDWILSDIRLTIDNHQFGSLKGSSTTHCLVRLLDDIHTVLDKPQNSAVVIATDFSKAFDRVDHNIVINKFIQLGVRTSLIPWIASFLSNRLQAVRYNGVLSTWETLHAGVPQGTKIGPISFLVMINDFVPNQLDIKHYKYVDDLTLCQTFSDPTESSSMQGELNHLQQWSDSNKMKLNPTKCQYMNICFQRSPAHIPPFVISDFQISQTKCMKLLGIYIQSNLKWDSQINNMCGNFNRRLFFLRQLKRSLVSVKDL